MKIAIFRKENRVSIDGEFRPVNLSSLDSRVRVIRWDTELKVGTVEWEPGTKMSIPVRDLQAEDRELKRRVAKNESLKGLEMKYVTLQVERGEQGLVDFAPYEPYVDAWKGATPPPAPKVEEKLAQPVLAVKEVLVTNAVDLGGRLV